METKKEMLCGFCGESIPQYEEYVFANRNACHSCSLEYEGEVEDSASEVLDRWNLKPMKDGL